MIGPVNSYSDIYVAACGMTFASHRQGIEHEHACPRCEAEIFYPDGPDEPSDYCQECDSSISFDDDNGSGLCPYCRNDP